jgi:hypothetical protein
MTQRTDWLPGKREETQYAGIFSRVVAAIVGGFAFTSMSIIALPFLLPGSKIQGIVGASLMGFALWTGAVIWAFAARSATRAWAGLAAATGAAGALAVLAKLAEWAAS